MHEPLKMHLQRGNALFLILIAVALFAALSYAVTRSGRGGGGIDRENTHLAKARLDSLAAEAKAAISRLMMFEGCSATEIAINSKPPFDTTARAKPNCDLYGPTGGGVSFGWTNTTVTLAAANWGNSIYDNYYPIDLGAGITLPLSLWYNELGGVPMLVLSGWTNRGDAGVSFEKAWAVAEVINKRENLSPPDAYASITNWVTTDYAQNPIFTWGQDSAGNNTDALEYAHLLWSQ